MNILYNVIIFTYLYEFHSQFQEMVRIEIVSKGKILVNVALLYTTAWVQPVHARKNYRSRGTVLVVLLNRQLRLCNLRDNLLF